jgi:N-acetylglucosamine-6-phosphate deacetylase
VRLGVRAALVDGTLVSGDVGIAEGRIASYGVSVPGGRGLAVPGLVDLHVNGFGGVDFLGADADGYRRAGKALLETGVTACLPTLITSPEDELVAAMREVPLSSTAPRILGVHLEGPFLSPSRLGVHPPAARRDPDTALAERLLAAGRVRMMTLAPELPCADALIDLLLARGVTVSAGHSDATAEQANAAFDRGVRTVTHLFNAMRRLDHRDPGLSAAALVRDDVTVQVINDGIHLAPETVRLVWQAAAGRIALVTDAVAGARAGDGWYRLGDLDIEVRDGAARGSSGGLAGSVLTMIDAVRNLHSLGTPLVDAVCAATAVPADVLGLSEVGRLEIGRPADIVVLDDSLEIERVLVGGEDLLE